MFTSNLGHVCYSLKIYTTTNHTVKMHRKGKTTLKIKKTNREAIKEFKIHRSLSFLREYSQCSTIHGVQHIFRENETIFHRLIWLLLFLTCLSGATYMTFNSWESYIKYPIAITVEDTQYPLYNILFPALSVCPTNKIIISKASDYLSKFVNFSLEKQEVRNFLTALSLLQHPVYTQMDYFLNKSEKILPLLSHVNVSELMLMSFPSCSDIFTRCYWQGNKVDCCFDLFSFQKSEEGFCYSFNSLTSERFRNCSYLDVEKEGCMMKFSHSNGPSTGLEVFFKVESISEAIELTGSPRLKVQIHNPYDFPEAGMGTLVPIGDMNKLIIAVKPTMTTSADNIRTLNEEVRGCTFKDEKISNLTNTFSQKSCLIECRIDYMIKLCSCIPYYFYTLGDAYPVCNSLQLLCILNISESLRFYKPPNYIVRGFQADESRNPLDCQHCLPACNEVKYDSVMELTKVPLKNECYIDIFYQNFGAVRYNRELTYDYVKLLVDLGGIGGLFLGGSLLSIIELLYWICKSLISFKWPLKHDNFKRKHYKNKKLFVSPSLILYD